MFEEEAEEYAKENKEVYGSDEYADITDYNNIKQAFLDGAEFGFDNAKNKMEKRIADLEKKNAKLKTKVTALENANRAMVKELDDMTSGGVSVLKNIVRSKEQLTKAKEIIKNCLRLWNDVMTEENVKALIIEAEQFLEE